VVPLDLLVSEKGNFLFLSMIVVRLNKAIYFISFAIDFLFEPKYYSEK
jgi:hypothetical protein